MGESRGGVVFRGQFSLAMDAKGRVNVPAVMRDALISRYEDPRLILATPFDRCLRAYPIQEWERIEAAAILLPQADRDVKIYMRRFIASASEVECDRQGRILLPPSHREWAGLANAGMVTFLGLVTCMEIWSKETYEAAQAVEDPETVQARITELGGRM